LNAPGDGDLLAWFQRLNRLEMAAVFIANGKTVKEIFDGGEADPFKIGRAPGPDAFQVLKRVLKKV
jgi:hypothetical protein